MTFERPFALLLLVAVLLAWWLHRTRRTAEVVRVASLLAFRGAAETKPSAAPRRAVDWRLALVLTATTLLAFAAAGPQFGATRPAAFYVVFDDSTSMSPTWNDAVHRCRDALHAAAADAELAEFDLSGRGRPRPSSDATLGPRFRKIDGLPGSLAPFLVAARTAGFPGIVLVTDRADVRASDWAVIGPSAGAKSNVAVAAAALDDEAAVVTLRNYGPADVAVTLRDGFVDHDTHDFVANESGRSTGVVVPARGVASARLPAPERGATAGYAIWSAERKAGQPADDLPADDWIAVERTGGAASIRMDGSASTHLRAAIASGGATRIDGGRASVVASYRAGAARSTEDKALVVAPPASAEAWGIRAARAANAVVRGDAVVGRGAFAEVLPAPSTTLVAETRLVGGEPIWSDSEGALAATNDHAVVLAVDPEDPRSDWHRDPSFPAFIAAALDRLAGGPDRLETLYAVPSSESDVVHDPPTTSSPEEIRAVMRPAGLVPDAVLPARWLALAAAALLLAAAACRGR